MFFAFEDLGWADRARVDSCLDHCYVVLSLLVTAIVFRSAKGLCAKLAFYLDQLSVVFFSQMASQ